jgi:predicted HicB family RNase H-like nuclease
MSPVSKAQQKANSKYVKNNYDEIKVRVPKGKKPEIQAAADKQGESLNSFVNTAIDERIARLEENTDV